MSTFTIAKDTLSRLYRLVKEFEMLDSTEEQALGEEGFDCVARYVEKIARADTELVAQVIEGLNEIMGI